MFCMIKFSRFLIRFYQLNKSQSQIMLSTDISSCLHGDVGNRERYVLKWRYVCLVFAWTQIAILVEMNK